MNEEKKINIKNLTLVSLVIIFVVEIIYQKYDLCWNINENVIKSAFCIILFVLEIIIYIFGIVILYLDILKYLVILIKLYIIVILLNFGNGFINILCILFKENIKIDFKENPRINATLLNIIYLIIKCCFLFCIYVNIKRKLYNEKCERHKGGESVMKLNKVYDDGHKKNIPQEKDKKWFGNRNNINKSNPIRNNDNVVVGQSQSQSHSRIKGFKFGGNRNNNKYWKNYLSKVESYYENTKQKSKSKYVHEDIGSIKSLNNNQDSDDETLNKYSKSISLSHSKSKSNSHSNLNLNSNSKSITTLSNSYLNSKSITTLSNSNSKVLSKSLSSSQDIDNIEMVSEINSDSYSTGNPILVPCYSNGSKAIYIDNSIPLAKPVPIYSCSEDSSSQSVITEQLNEKNGQYAQPEYQHITEQLNEKNGQYAQPEYQHITEQLNEKNGQYTQPEYQHKNIISSLNILNDITDSSESEEDYKKQQSSSSSSSNSSNNSSSNEHIIDITDTTDITDITELTDTDTKYLMKERNSNNNNNNSNTNTNTSKTFERTIENVEIEIEIDKNEKEKVKKSGDNGIEIEIENIKENKNINESESESESEDDVSKSESENESKIKKIVKSQSIKKIENKIKNEIKSEEEDEEEEEENDKDKDSDNKLSYKGFESSSISLDLDFDFSNGYDDNNSGYNSGYSKVGYSGGEGSIRRDSTTTSNPRRKYSSLYKQFDESYSQSMDSSENEYSQYNYRNSELDNNNYNYNNNENTKKKYKSHLSNISNNNYSFYDDDTIINNKGKYDKDHSRYSNDILNENEYSKYQTSTNENTFLNENGNRNGKEKNSSQNRYTFSTFNDDDDDENTSTNYYSNSNSGNDDNNESKRNSKSSSSSSSSSSNSSSNNNKNQLNYSNSIQRIRQGVNIGYNNYYHSQLMKKIEHEEKIKEIKKKKINEISLDSISITVSESKSNLISKPKPSKTKSKTKSKSKSKSKNKI